MASRSSNERWRKYQHKLLKIASLGEAAQRAYKAWRVPLVLTFSAVALGGILLASKLSGVI